MVNIIVCKHVLAGKQPEVLSGSSDGTEFAVCYDCADEIEANPQGGDFLSVICGDHATNYGIPATLPGPLGFWHLRNGQFERQPDIPDANA